MIDFIENLQPFNWKDAILYTLLIWVYAFMFWVIWTNGGGKIIK